MRYRGQGRDWARGSLLRSKDSIHPIRYSFTSDLVEVRGAVQTLQAAVRHSQTLLRHYSTHRLPFGSHHLDKQVVAVQEVVGKLLAVHCCGSNPLVRESLAFRVIYDGVGA